MGKGFTRAHQTRKLPIIVLSKIARFPGTIKTQKPLIDGHAPLCPSYSTGVAELGMPKDSVTYLGSTFSVQLSAKLVCQFVIELIGCTRYIENH
jgi:hypothetical protein